MAMLVAIGCYHTESYSELSNSAFTLSYLKSISLTFFVYFPSHGKIATESMHFPTNFICL